MYCHHLFELHSLYTPIITLHFSNKSGILHVGRLFSQIRIAFLRLTFQLNITFSRENHGSICEGFTRQLTGSGCSLAQISPCKTLNDVVSHENQVF